MSSQQPDGFATPLRHVTSIEGLHISLEDIFERTRALDADLSSRASSPRRPVVDSVATAPIPTTNTPDRTPSGVLDSIFTLSPNSFDLELFENDGNDRNPSSITEPPAPSTPSSASGTSGSPMSSASFSFSSPRSTMAMEPGTSFDTTLTTPSPTSKSISPLASTTGKGKQRAIHSEFDTEISATATESIGPVGRFGNDYGSVPGTDSAYERCMQDNLDEPVAGPSNQHAATFDVRYLETLVSDSMSNNQLQ